MSRESKRAYERISRAIERKEESIGEIVLRIEAYAYNKILNDLIIELGSAVGVEEYYKTLHDPITRVAERFGLEEQT